MVVREVGSSGVAFFGLTHTVSLGLATRHGGADEQAAVRGTGPGRRRTYKSIYRVLPLEDTAPNLGHASPPEVRHSSKTRLCSLGTDSDDKPVENPSDRLDRQHGSRRDPTSARVGYRS
jgi:hypothetical protein